MNQPNPYRLGIALAGGGARGIAHVGVLKALEEHGIVPDCVAGTSAGSLVGTMYAAGKSPEEMMELFAANSNLIKLVRLGLPTVGLTKLTAVREQLEAMIPEDDFAALEKPLHIAITNLTTGELEIRNAGKLLDVVIASCSIPIIFQAVKMENQLFVDGGLMLNLPAEPLYARCDYVIGVNVMPNVTVKTHDIDNLMDIGMRCFEMSIAANTEMQLALCNHIIEPDALYDFHPLSFGDYEEIFQIGYQATLAQIDQILENIGLC